MSNMDLLPTETDFAGDAPPYDLATITPNQDNPDDRPPTGDSSLELETPRSLETTPQEETSEDYTRPVSKYIQAVMPYPSDKVVLRTFGIVANDPGGPTLVLNRQIRGWACRVRIRNVGTSPVWVLTNNENAARNTVVATQYPTGFLLPAAAGELSELDLSTREAIWAIVPGVAGTNDGLVSVASESYVC